MSRSVPWRRQITDLVNWRQTEAQNATIYILRETGPTGFLLKDEAETKPCKAFLGDPHSCTCAQFMKDRDLCKHICWLLLKKFRVPATNAMSWQKGLVEREINEILRGITQQQRKKVSTAITRWRRPTSSDSDARETIPQRDIAEDDVCPICQDELLLKRLPVTYCKFGCGNSIHIKCMKVWAEHQKSQGETVVKCPFCREDFGPFEMLKYENRNAGEGTQAGRMDRHLGATCQSCRTSPIEGKCYRCSTCADFHLCQSCFNTPIHTQHAFQYRHKRNQGWRAAGRAYGAVLPQAVLDDLVNRDISENDYDLLVQLDSNTAAPVGSDIPDDVVQSFPVEKIRGHGPLLQPGVQCRICLHGYQLGQMVKKLPRCKHKFHKECIDNWLLHTRPTCPVDGQVVWDRITAQLDEPAIRNSRPRKRSQTEQVQGANGVQLEIPGVGLALHGQEAGDRRGLGVARGRGSQWRTRDRSDREAERVLGSNLSLAGSAVGTDSEAGHHSLPGGRLLQRVANRRAVLEDSLATIEAENQQGINALTNALNGQTDMDPLDEVMAANFIANMRQDGTSQASPSYHRSNNHTSIFGRQAAAVDHSATLNLLVNAERLSSYNENPDIFADAVAQEMAVESVRSEEVNNSVSHADQRATVPMNHVDVFRDIPADQRLFGSEGDSNSHIMFRNPARGGHSRNTQGRQPHGSSSAPVNGGIIHKGQLHKGRPKGLVMLKRGRAANRGHSQDRPRDASLDRGQQKGGVKGQLANGAQVPKEGENLLERLTLFTDLYCGNNPRSQPVVTATGLPPRPPRRPIGNHAAARQRRFENERRRTEFTLEGNAYNDVTLRDILR